MNTHGRARSQRSNLRVLADRRCFTATRDQYDQFVALLDRPVDTSRLAALAARPSVFDKPFELDH